MKTLGRYVQTAINKFGDKDKNFRTVGVKPANNIGNKNKNFVYI